MIFLSSATLAFFVPYLFIDHQVIGWAAEGKIGFGVALFLMLLATGKEVMTAPDGIGVLGRASQRMFERAYCRLGCHPSIYVVRRVIDSAISITALFAIGAIAVLAPVTKYLLLFVVSALAGRIAQHEFDEEGFGDVKACFSNVYTLTAFALVTFGGWFIYDLQQNCLLSDSTGTSVFEVMGVYGGSFLVSLGIGMVSAVVYDNKRET